MRNWKLRRATRCHRAVARLSMSFLIFIIWINTKEESRTYYNCSLRSPDAILNVTNYPTFHNSFSNSLDDGIRSSSTCSAPAFKFKFYHSRKCLSWSSTKPVLTVDCHDHHEMFFPQNQDWKRTWVKGGKRCVSLYLIAWLSHMREPLSGSCVYLRNGLLSISRDKNEILFVCLSIGKRFLNGQFYGLKGLLGGSCEAHKRPGSWKVLCFMKRLRCPVGSLSDSFQR